MLMLLQKIKSLIVRIFTRPKVEAASTPISTGDPKNVDTVMEDGDTFDDDYSEKLNGLDDIVAGLGVHRRMTASNRQLFNMGKRDGAAGIRTDIGNIARCTARLMFQQLFVLVKGRLGALDAQLQSEKNIMEVEEKLYRNEQAYHDYITYQYRFFPRNYSFLLAGIYFVVAFLLIVADLPLALKLIQKGFDIEGPGFGDLFVQGEFWSTLAANWETGITALGIALCTVYIKIFYDEYVGTPYGNKLMSNKKFIDENGFQHDDEEMSRQVSQESKGKFAVKVLLVTATIVCIVILALFRNETNTPDQGPPKMYAMMAFLAITILFPVIGGVCLSYSLNNLQNRLRLIRAKRICEKRLQRLKEKVQQYTLTKSNHEDLAAAVERLGNEQEMIEEYKDYLLAYYRRGYALGAQQPDNHVKEQDFFNRVEHWRNLLLSKAINQSTNN